MNAGPTADRVYEAIKRRIMNRSVKPGERLDPATLSEDLVSSVTPVRDALHQLTGEGLVETWPAGGFHVPAVDAPGLADLFTWAGEVGLLAIRAWPRVLPVPSAWSDADRWQSVAEHAAALFAAMARRSVNTEHHRAMQLVNERLHAARLVEEVAMGDARDELQALGAALASGDRALLGRRVTSYARRRRRFAAEIVRALYRAE